jgi:outer membrane protein assembly factor BamB
LVTLNESQETASMGIHWLPAPGNYLCGLTWDGTYLWHSDQNAAEIYAIDRVTGSVVRTSSCHEVRADLTYDGSMLCQVGGKPKRLLLVDPVSGTVTGQRGIPPASGRVTGVEIGPEGLWLVLRAPNVVQLRDYPAMAIRREYPVPGSAPSGLTYADGIVVFGEFQSGALHAIDAETGVHVGSMRLDGRPTGMTWDGEWLWYCDFPARALRPVDLADLLTGARGNDAWFPE